MRSLKLAALVALTVGTTQTASAQQQFKFLSGGTVTGYGYYVGPYLGGTGPNYTTQVILNCVDFFHEISINQIWTANLTNLSNSDLSKTRWGPQFADAATRYRQAAYLTTLYAGKTSTQIAQIQTTIWRLFDSNLLVNPTPPDPQTNIWLTMAQQNYQSIDPNSFYIITDVNKNLSTGGDNPYSAQEFIGFYASPEPASMALLGTGLAGLFGARRRRKKQQQLG